MAQWTEQHLQRLLRQGKIRSYTVKSTAKQTTAASLPVTQKRSREKNWLSWNLKIWAEEKGLLLVTEHQFHSERHWRFDWSFPGIMVAVEYEGIFSTKSRHTTLKGFLGDVEKYNTATALGWRIIRVTAKDYKTVLSQLKEYV